MDLELKVKNGSEFTSLTQEQITDIKQNFVVCIPDGGRVVIFSETAPLDTCYPWQKVDVAGAPIGKIQYFKEGVWS